MASFLARMGALFLCGVLFFSSSAAFAKERGGLPKSAEERLIKEPLTLREAFRRTLKRSEDIAIKIQVMEEAEAHFYEALGVVLPDFKFQYTHFQQDAAGGGSESFTGNSLRRTTPQRKFVLSQPLFSGFKEVAALQASGAEKAQRHFEKKRAQELLFLDVVEGFYGVLEAEKDWKALSGVAKALSERVEELKRRARLGRTRQSEVEATLAELKKTEAETAQAAGVLAVAQALLEFYVGDPIEGGFVDEDILAGLRDRTHYLAKTAKRSDVRASKEAYTLASKQVMVAQSGLWPHATLDGNFYTDRVGFQSGIDWDLLFTIDVPIFDAAQTWADIKESGALKEEARLTMNKTLRQADLEIRQNYETLKASWARERALKEAADASRESFRLNAEEYKTNLVSNLEVLDVLRQSLDAERDWIDAHYQAKTDFWKLKVAAGEV